MAQVARQPAKGALTCLDLFCGCGGFTLGLERAGFRCLAAIDFNAEAVTTFKANFRKDVDLAPAVTTGNHGGQSYWIST